MTDGQKDLIVDDTTADIERTGCPECGMDERLHQPPCGCMYYSCGTDVYCKERLSHGGPEHPGLHQSGICKHMASIIQDRNEWKMGADAEAGFVDELVEELKPLRDEIRTVREQRNEALRLVAKPTRFELEEKWGI